MVREERLYFAKRWETAGIAGVVNDESAFRVRVSKLTSQIESVAYSVQLCFSAKEQVKLFAVLLYRSGQFHWKLLLRKI